LIVGRRRLVLRARRRRGLVSSSEFKKRCKGARTAAACHPGRSAAPGTRYRRQSAFLGLASRLARDDNSERRTRLQIIFQRTTQQPCAGGRLPGGESPAVSKNDSAGTRIRPALRSRVGCAIKKQEADGFRGRVVQLEISEPIRSVRA
jgi:hypothetical protein